MWLWQREWPQPRNTRHVWVIGEDRLTPPVQGFVLAWRRHSYKWSALVVRVDETGDGATTLQGWLPAERLRPVRADPNKVLTNWKFTEILRPPPERRHR